MSTIVDGVASKWVYAGDQYVAVASGRIAGGWSEVMANARLIAAAPGLLAACKVALAQFEVIDRHFDNFDPEGDLRWSDPETMGLLRAAIADAEPKGGHTS